MPDQRPRRQDDGEVAFLVSLGTQLRVLRIRRHLTQHQLAERAGVTRNFISGLERGIHASSVRRLRRLAIALDVEVADLIPPITPRPTDVIDS